MYLSLPGGARKYSLAPGALHLVDADGGRDRVLVAEARHYGEHRAVVWWGEDELVYLDGRGVTHELHLSTGATSELAAPAKNGEGWLIAPGGRVATGATPTFSDYATGRGVSLRPTLGGCAPAFSNDGRFAVWSAGAGGPVDALDLATRRSWTVLEKGDSRFPADRGYLYFPMLSNDDSMLAVGASAGAHDHFRADYDIYVLELDPQTLLPAGRALPVAPHPAIDRYPDLFRPGRRTGNAATSAAAGGPSPAGAPAKGAGLPSATAQMQRGLVFVWRNAEDENRVAPGSASEILQAHGLAWFDAHRALALGGGFFSAEAETGRRLHGALLARNQLTVALLVSPASLHELGAIAAFSDGARARNFVLRQEGDRIVLTLRTSETAKEGTSVPIARLDSTAPHYIQITFTPGRLKAFVDGAQAGETTPLVALPGDFFHWRPRALTFGSEEQNEERWHGTLSEIAIWNRPLDDPEIAAEAARIRTLLAARPATARAIVEVRLRAASPAPSLDEISPYREALALDELEVLRQISGPPLAGTRIRVARWAILDTQVIAAPKAGESYRLVLEPFAAQPQLEQFFLADRLPSSPGLPLFFDLGATAAP